jgi:enterochelin esterase-like enzyme
VGISLISGWFPSTVVVIALAVLALAVGWRTLRWRVAVLGLGVLAIGLTAGIWAYVTANQLIVPALPLMAYSWAAAVVFSVLVAIAGWPSARPRQRALGPVSVLLTTLMTACLVNGYYAYFPTVQSLVGSPTAHQVSAEQVAAVGMRGNVAVGYPAQALPSHGVTFQVTIPGVVSHFRARSAWVYLPPAWFVTPRPRLPVVMLLEGTPSHPVDWFRAGLADRTADRFAARHGGLAPVLVLPDENGSVFGDTECLNQVHARAEDYLVHDVRQFMIAKYGTASNPSAWAVAGLSEGGTCAMDLALRHSNLFRQFGDFAGDPAPQLLTPGQTLRVLFHGSRAAQAKFDPVNLLAQRPRTRSMSAFFEAGRGDHARARLGHVLARLAARSGIRTRWRTVPGPHNFVVWGESFHSALDFFWPRFVWPGHDSPLLTHVVTVTNRRLRHAPKGIQAIGGIGRPGTTPTTASSRS